MKDYYKILKLEPSASLSEIRISYKKLILEIRRIDEMAKRVERIPEVVEAYEILKNPISKRKYDVLIKNSISSSKIIRKSFTKSKILKYESAIKTKAVKSTYKADKLINKSDVKVNRDLNVGDLVFNFDELVEFILNIIFAIFDAN